MTVTTENFQEIIADNEIVLLDFWAGWCGPCRQFGPIFEKVSTAHPDIVFGKVDTEAQRELAAGFQITSIPTLFAFRDGILVFGQPGAMQASGLEHLIAGVRGLDMDEVRRQVAEGVKEREAAQ